MAGGYTLLKGTRVVKTATHYLYVFRAVGATPADVPIEGKTLFALSADGDTGTALATTNIAPVNPTTPYPLITGTVHLDAISEPGRIIATGTAIESIAMTASYA